MQQVNVQIKPQTAKFLHEKKNEPTGPRKKFKKKIKSKGIKKSKVGLNLSTKIKKISKCVTCPANYTSFVIDSKVKCLMYGTNRSISSVASTCAKDGARLPLPMNAKENADLLIYFLSKRKKTEGEVPLDLRNNKTDGDFISSFGQKVNFTNWRTKEGQNKTSKQFVIMDIDGFWNEFDSVNTSTNIICQMNCPNCEYS